MRGRWLAIAGLAVAAGCDGDGAGPSTLVDEPRILAVKAEPPLVDVDGVASLEALVADPLAASGRRDDVELSMRACSPWRPLLDPEIDCGADASLPLQNATIAVADLLDRFPPPAGAVEAAAAAPRRCELDVAAVEVPIVIELAGATATPVVKSLPISLEPDPPPRTNPDIAAVVSGVPDRRVVTAEFDRATVDDVCGADDPELLELESFEVFAYASAGRFDDASFDAELARDGREAIGALTWRLEDGEERAFLWLVAVDGRGGTGWVQAAVER